MPAPGVFDGTAPTVREPSPFSRFIARSLARLVTVVFAAVLAGLYFYDLALNMQASSGLPYWDDWQYFFGDVQGLHVPLTWANLFAKEADYVAPLLRAAGHGLWLAVGADFIALRMLMWALFGIMLVVYARLLMRLAAGSAWGPAGGPAGERAPLWAVALVAPCLLGGTVMEYFYYQHMAFGQPLFFILFLACLWALAARAWLLGVVLMALAASMSIFGASYAVGAAAYALALAVAAIPRRGWRGFADPTVWAAAPVGLAVAVAIGWLTFSDSYANHTGQGFVMPWNPDFWVFTLSAFASALGVGPEWPARVVLPAGLFGVLLFVVPPLWMLWRRPADERVTVEFALGALLAGTVIITLVTAAGRVYLCGADLAAVKSCGATPRYVYPIVIALPAAVLAAALAAPWRGVWRLLVTVIVTAAVLAGHIVDRQGRASLAHWDFGPLNRMLVERDGAARVCLADYLALVLPADRSVPDWSRPLVCPGMWAAKNLAPYLKTAYETGAPFMPGLLADAARAARRPSVEALLALGGPSADGRSLWGTFPAATEAEARGHIDRFYDLKDGTPAISGWAVDLAARGPVARIVAVLGNRIVAIGAAGAERPDVAAVFGDPEQRTGLKRGGFVVPLPGLNMADAASLRVFAVTATLKALELDGLPRQTGAAAPEPGAAADGGGSRIAPATDITGYADGRPFAPYRLDARDHGVVLRHGGAPGDADRYGARDAWAFRAGAGIYLHYDAAGPDGWRTARAVSWDGLTFTGQGTVLGLGAPGAPDSASASYGLTYRDGDDWHMFYLGTAQASPPPGRIPVLPYATLKARAASPDGPWIKQPQAVLFAPEPGTYYAETASPGPVIKQGGSYWQFFSAAMPGADGGISRTLGIARADRLDGPWRVDPAPILPPGEQIENAALYFQQETGTWFLFTNHVGLRDGVEFTDAIWVYWSQDPERWDPARKAVVLDGRNARWSKNVIGLPSVVPMGDRLAIYYDGLAMAAGPNGGDDPFSHLGRDIGLAWLDLPIRLPRDGETAPTGRARLLDVVDPPVDPPGELAAAPDARCFLERINQAAPSGPVVTGSRLLSVAGWSVLSAGQGRAAEAVTLVLQPEAGGAPVYVKARRTPRPDVKAHIGHPGMAGDAGFAAAADLGGLSGAYRLDVLQQAGGTAFPCGFDQRVEIR